MEKAILIGVQTYTSHSFAERMEEMKELALAGSLTLAHSQYSQMSFMYGFFFVKFLQLYVL